MLTVIGKPPAVQVEMTVKEYRLEPYHITRETLGSLLPDGWAIEVSDGWYTPFLGQEIGLQPHRKLVDALYAIQLWRKSPVYKAVVQGIAEALEQRRMFEE